MSGLTPAKVFLTVMFFLLPSVLEAETVHYSGEISRPTEDWSENIQLRLNFKGTIAEGAYSIDRTGEVFTLEGRNQPEDRMYLDVVSNNTHSADIKLVKYISTSEWSDYAIGTVHWIGYIFDKHGRRELVHLVETISSEKHPVFTDRGWLTGVAYFLNISFDPETGRQIFSLSARESIGPGLEGTECINRGIPWLDCQLNYHPVDGCYLTEPQRELCSKGPFFDSSDHAAVGSCWSYEKGPGIQLPFQQAATSKFNLSEVEVVRMEGDLAEAREVRVSRVQVGSGENFLNRPVCESASAYGPASAGIAPVDPP